MKPGLMIRLVGVALLVMVVNVICSILYMVLYGHVINPGHDDQYYRDHIQVAAPYCSIVAGIPLMMLAGWWVAGWRAVHSGVSAALVVWLAYAIVDFGILLAAGLTAKIAVLVTVSLLTKLAAVYFGAVIRSRSPSLNRAGT